MASTASTAKVVSTASSAKEVRRSQGDAARTAPTSRHDSAIVNERKILPSRCRAGTARAITEMAELARMEEQQHRIRDAKLEELRQRFANIHDNSAVPHESCKAMDHKAYASYAALPALELRPPRLHFDEKAEALLVPWTGGAFVPFHASTIKNMTRTTLDGLQVLRINFWVPGQGKRADEYPALTPSSAFVKELTFKSEQRDNFDNVQHAFKLSQRRIKETQVPKPVRGARGIEPVPVGPLQPSCTPIVLRDVNIRPKLGTGRRSRGNLEAHANGFRFSSGGLSEKVDILYTQIKNAIFQPCETGSSIVLVHFHLHQPMSVGKKTTQDIQIFSECGTLVDDLSQRRVSSVHDPDELLEEQNEQRLKEQRNKMYQEFFEPSQSQRLMWDMAMNATAFDGVPNKQRITLCFTKHCMVALQKWPPIVIDFLDVDVAVFERDVHSLREFDMVLVLKDYHKPPLRITMIPKNSMNGIKTYFGQLELPWFSCSMSMQWQFVMKEINGDPARFVENGGWGAWFASSRPRDSDSEDGQGESDFEASSDEDDEDFGGSDFEMDADDDDEDGALPSDEDRGESWGKLEERAERADRKRDREGRSPSAEREMATRGTVASKPPANASKPPKRARRMR